MLFFEEENDRNIKADRFDFDNGYSFHLRNSAEFRKLKWVPAEAESDKLLQSQITQPDRICRRAGAETASHRESGPH